jgi:RecJ-like exonuclease
MTTVPFTIDDGENEPVEVQLPARWEICDRCNGEGKSSAHLGAFTGDQMREDPDFAEDYMNGMYDKSCHVCSGTGKVKEIIRGSCTTPEQKRALELMDDRAASEAESRAERRAEARMMGELDDGSY